jgi:hypothetical protein
MLSLQIIPHLLQSILQTMIPKRRRFTRSRHPLILANDNLSIKDTPLNPIPIPLKRTRWNRSTKPTVEVVGGVRPARAAGALARRSNGASDINRRGSRAATAGAAESLCNDAVTLSDCDRAAAAA